jgi:hypothetical protein
MKLTVPALLISALMVASPAAFAQKTGDYGNSSTPGAGAGVKDGQTLKVKKSKRHASAQTRSHKKHKMSAKAKAETTGYSGSSSAPGAGVAKDEMDIQKSRKK